MATFDTLKYANRLKAVGMAPELAEAEAMALVEVFEANIDGQPTKADLRELELAARGDLKHMENRVWHRIDLLESRIEAAMERHFAAVDQRQTALEGKLALRTWMLGVIVAGVVGLILRTFFR